MSDAIELRGLGQQFRRRWWIPAVLAVVGAFLGVTVSEVVAPIHRAQGTLLVGPINGSVTQSTTLNASESLASFYADLARRELVLNPVAQNLNPPMTWDQLRNEVSAVVPDQNPRLITVTVADADKDRSMRIADAIVRRLVAISPAPSGQTEQEFVNEQVDSIRATIKQGERDLADLETSLAAATDPTQRTDLARQVSDQQAQIDEWRHTYVELMSVDTTADAGAVRVVDDVAPVGSLDRAGTVRQAILGGLVGLMVGLAIVWLLSRRDERPRPPDREPPLEPEPREPVAATRRPEVAVRRAVGSVGRAP